MLKHQFGGITIHLDQEIAAGIQSDEPLGQALIKSSIAAAEGCRCFRVVVMPSTYKAKAGGSALKGSSALIASISSSIKPFTLGNQARIN